MQNSLNNTAAKSLSGLIYIPLDMIMDKNIKTEEIILYAFLHAQQNSLPDDRQSLDHFMQENGVQEKSVEKSLGILELRGYIRKIKVDGHPAHSNCYSNWHTTHSGAVYMQHMFDVNIATLFDTDTAVFLHQMNFWITTNAANRKNFHKGNCWTYNSHEAFTDMFPYWTKRQVQHLISKCVKNGLILKDKFNRIKYDHTCWYALTEKALEFYPLLKNLIKKNYQEPQQSIKQNCAFDAQQMSSTKNTNVAPIPVSKTVSKTDILKPLVDSPKSTGHKDDSSFRNFYDSYPNKQKPEAAYKAWKKLKPDEQLQEQIINDVRLRKENNWKERHKSKIPHPSTYLNTKEWEGEIVPPEHNTGKLSSRKDIVYDDESTSWIDDMELPK